MNKERIMEILEEGHKAWPESNFPDLKACFDDWVSDHIMAELKNGRNHVLSGDCWCGPEVVRVEAKI